jgi:hypothetical protein
MIECVLRAQAKATINMVGTMQVVVYESRTWAWA